MSIFLVMIAGAAAASVDHSAPPGGVYRLKPGIYVARGSDCGSPANAAILRYDGKGLSGAHSRACRARILRRDKRHYTVEQSCIDAGAGPASRSTQGQDIYVSDALTFRQVIGRNSSTYRYCAATELPADLRGYPK